MARAADPDSADSQFYIALGPQPHLDGAYTVFGQVVEGMDVVRRLVPGDQITSITVE
jgi:cyclophilin family peptidyl-prolyl cis-trans isomerase